ncbi:phosphotransferase [Providencia rettgeri]|uniref:phosphotransferase n=1 Tax=Providencia rettgeri TaxID=587 RepID=UPI0034E0781A
MDEDIIKINKIGGMTNINYFCETSVRQCVVRIPGDNTEVMINREYEKFNCQLATELQLNPELYHYDLESGIKITAYINQSLTLTPQSVTEKNTLKMIASTLKKLHSSNLKFANHFNVFEQYRNYIKTLVKSDISYNKFEKTEEFFYALEEILRYKSNVLVACHNDPVPENFLLKNSNIYLIDWEYSGMNDPIWDISAFFEESNLSDEYERYFLELYYEKEVSNEILEKILIYKICQNFLWSVWTLIKEKNEKLFGDYGNIRYQKCLKQIELYKERHYEK